MRIPGLDFIPHLIKRHFLPRCVQGRDRSIENLFERALCNHDAIAVKQRVLGRVHRHSQAATLKAVGNFRDFSVSVNGALPAGQRIVKRIPVPLL